MDHDNVTIPGKTASLILEALDDAIDYRWGEWDEDDALTDPEAADDIVQAHRYAKLHTQLADRLARLYGRADG